MCVRVEINPYMAYNLPMLYTPTQAAAVTGLPLKTIQKAIDSKVVPVRIRRIGSIRKRYLNGAALICLRLEANGLKQLSASLRHKIYRGIMKKPHQGRIQFSGVMWIDLAAVRKEVALSLQKLRKVEDMVVSDPEILGGVPVFRNTRVPVHAIAEMLDSGTSVADILAGYPSISEEKIRLALLYDQAHPRRGRPATTPWAGSKPVRRFRKRLSSAA